MVGATLAISSLETDIGTKLEKIKKVLARTKRYPLARVNERLFLLSNEH